MLHNLLPSLIFHTHLISLTSALMTAMYDVLAVKSCFKQMAHMTIGLTHEV